MLIEIGESLNRAVSREQSRATDLQVASSDPISSGKK
jgi:hypothetical protein